ncbi:MAG: sigma-54 dependent transcriptional regulator [Chloroherpetonaceae bacterium]|nr:sigma-54 dependent transcriptional regulator [Chloroherpetonaceae bacterium]
MKKATTILIADDDTSVVASLSLLLKQSGYQAFSSANPKETLEVLQKEKIQVVIQDMNFTRRTDGEEGLILLREIKKKYPELPVILMTAWGSIALAVKGMQWGAADFITKPWTNEEVLHRIETQVGLKEVDFEKKGESNLSRESLDHQFDFSMIIGESPKICSALEIIGRVAKTDAPVLLLGESGTGKELFAEALHKNSNRHKGPFVKVNVGSIPNALFESELFGHVKGAFTDAKQDRKGRFEMASGGTILLDEIGDLDYASQVKLLRVIQERTFEPLGSSKTQSVNVRIVAATHRNLQSLIAEGKFREDLFYRLNLITVMIPPLRERVADISAIAEYYLRHASHLYHTSFDSKEKKNLSFTAGAIRFLKEQPWKGNVRELRHAIERVALLATSPEISEQDFIRVQSLLTDSIPSGSGFPTLGTMTLDEMERTMIERAIEEHNGNISRIAESLGISRAALYRRLEKFRITIP